MTGLDTRVLAVLFLAAQGTDSALSYPRLKEGLRDAVARDPMDAVLATVVGGSFLFYLAERGVNPKIESPWDALIYVSTCLSVGYHDVFPKTPAGKAIATAVMTFGPAMSSRILEGGSSEPELTPEMLKVQQVIADKLDAILVELRRR